MGCEHQWKTTETMPDGIYVAIAIGPVAERLEISENTEIEARDCMVCHIYQARPRGETSPWVDFGKTGR